MFLLHPQIIETADAVPPVTPNAMISGTRAGTTILGCWLVTLLIATISSDATELQPAPELEHLRTESGHTRVDLIWDQGAAICYEIERRDPGSDTFHRINKRLWTSNVYSDLIGKTNGTYEYRVRGALASPDKHSTTLTAWSPAVTAAPRLSSTEQLLSEVQKASFRYFYDFRHPVSGLAREKTPPRETECAGNIDRHCIDNILKDRNLCTTGATGMGMFNLIVGVERGFISRQQGADWALQMLRFLSSKAERFHGAFSHWLNGSTGRTIPFSGKTDNGADTVETAFLASGLIVLREYFKADTPEEHEIRTLADSLWKGIEWDWFIKDRKPGSPLLWHWSPDYGWEKGLPVRGFNEAQIVYILALASPTHPICPESYFTGWMDNHYGRERTEFGVPLTLGRELGPPLFFTHYSYLGFDPRTIFYRGTSYFDHFQRFCIVQQKYAQSKSETFKGYGPLWGLTSSADPGFYAAHAPGHSDNGTIAPTAALSSMPYAPQESLACLRTLYTTYGNILWTDFGFTDAFNLSRNWIANLSLGIDAGPIAPMIENHRTGLCWNTFMHAPEIKTIPDILNRSLHGSPSANE